MKQYFGLSLLVLFIIIAIAGIMLLQNVMAPFFIAALLAYLMMPLKKYLCAYMNDAIATSLLLLGFILILLLFIIFFIPLIALSLRELLLFIPVIYQSLMMFVHTLQHSPIAELLAIDKDMLVNNMPSVATLAEYANQYGRDISQSMLTGISSIIGLLSFLVLLPILLFYMLRDGDHLRDHLMAWIPQRQQGNVRQVIQDVLDNLKLFLRGQVIVCLLLACYYVIGLWLVGFTHAFIIGIIIGIISFIPIVGGLAGGGLAIIMAYFTAGGIGGNMSGDAIGHVIVVTIIFGIGQLLESYILTPKFIGERLGLHALIVIFVLMAGASLGGITGALLALPFTAMIEVIYRVYYRHYQQSEWYKKP